LTLNREEPVRILRALVEVLNAMKLAVRILVVQAATTLVIAALFLVFAGRIHALSALAGGMIGLIANAWMTMTALRPTATAGGALGRLMFGQFVKVLITIGMLFAVARGGWANWPALLAAYLATLAVFWFVPMQAMRMRRVKN
jgi:F0F1-type ATP synthase assembly protein I